MVNDEALDLIKLYFPNLDSKQVDSLIDLADIYREWNQKVNLVSRKDIDNLFSRHILHALSIAKFISFKPESEVLDLGTGGGLPGLPLAIYFPEVRFHLVDARSKKIMVVQDMIERLELKNVKAEHRRVETLRSKYDFIVSRAVSSVQQILAWSSTLLSDRHRNAIPNGYLLLKGGDLLQEMRNAGVHNRAEIEPLDQWFNDPWYVEKKILYIPK